MLMRTSNLTEREISGIKDHHSGADRARAGQKRPSLQTIVAKNREEVMDDLREAGDRARNRSWWIR